MTEEKALTTTKPSALDVYGSGDDIKTLARRIKVCLPGGNKLQEHDALALAQLSIAYGLNPFNGEVWIIVDKQGVSRGTMVGIKGLRKAARKQGNYWPTFDILGKADKQALNIPENAIAYRCNIYRTDLLRQSAEAVDLMRKAGMANAFEVYAYKPAEGIGYCNPGESTKMKPDQAARKRAEAEALKVAFDLPFSNEVGNGNRIGYVDAEEWEVQAAIPASGAGTTSGPEYPEDMTEDEPVAIFSDIPPAEPPVPAAVSPGPVQAPPQPAERPPVVEKPVPPKTPRVNVKTGRWNNAAIALAAEQPYYQSDGQPNFYKMLNAASKHAGVSEITDANLADVIAALTAHAVAEMEIQPGDVVTE